MNRKICAVVLALVMCFTFIININSAEAQRKVRVGYMDYNGFIEKEGEQAYDGYGAAYLMEVAKYTKWDYEFIFDNWPNLLEKLKKGEIDLLCTAQKTPEREQYFDFSEYPIGAESTVLYTWAGNDKIAFDEYSAMNGAKIALLRDSFQTEIFSDLASQYGFKYIPVYYESEEDMLKAVQSKQVDIIGTGSLALHPEMKKIGEFGSDPFYFITTKGNNEIISQVNSALKRIRDDKPYFQLELHKRYYAGNAVSHDPLFTREEINFIKSCPPIKIGSFSQREPLSYIDENGNLAGINIDLLNLIAKKSKLKFEYEGMPVEGWPIKLLDEKKYDLVAGVMRTNSILSNPKYKVTGEFQNIPLVSVARKDRGTLNNENATVAVNVSYVALINYLKAKHPNMKLITYKNTEACIEAVKDKKAEMFIQNIYVVSELLNKAKYEDLEMVPIFTMNESTCLVGLNSQDPMLFEVLDKTMEVLGEDEIERIVINHTIAKPAVFSYSDFFYKYKVEITSFVVLFIFFMILFHIYLRNKEKTVLFVEKKNKKLEAAVKLAEEANNAKSVFLSNMSHEIRTPMNAIVGMTSIAKKKYGNIDGLKDYLDKTAYASNHLLELINDILDMSAIQRGKIKIVEKRFDIKELLSSLTNIYYTRCKEKGVELNLEVQNLTDEVIIGDQLRVHQILSNLLSNAYKFTSKGQFINIVVTQVKTEEKDVILEFTVEDSGEGMTEDMVSRLFKPFEQEDDSTALKHGGSGLGLSITKNLVDLMHGTIQCESIKDKGSKFTVTIPFGKVDMGKAFSSEDLSKYKVLSLEDTRSSKQVAGVLNRIGVRCNAVTSKEECFKELTLAKENSDPYNICFLDFDLKNIDEEDIIGKIKSDYSNVLIVGETYNMSGISPNVKGMGVDYFLNKPIFQSTIFNFFMTLSGGKIVKAKEEPENYDFKGKKVLLVEDNELNREIAKELLNMVNLEVDSAENGKEAVDKFNASNPGEYSIIFMDVFMPIMDGLEATKEIRASAHPDAQTISILAMTANAFTEDVAETRKAGMNDHISKPIDVTVFYQTIKKFLEE